MFPINVSRQLVNATSLVAKTISAAFLVSISSCSETYRVGDRVVRDPAVSNYSINATSLLLRNSPKTHASPHSKIATLTPDNVKNSSQTIQEFANSYCSSTENPPWKEQFEGLLKKHLPSDINLQLKSYGIMDGGVKSYKAVNIKYATKTQRDVVNGIFPNDVIVYFDCQESFDFSNNQETQENQTSQTKSQTKVNSLSVFSNVFSKHGECFISANNTASIKTNSNIPAEVLAFLDTIACLEGTGSSSDGLSGYNIRFNHIKFRLDDRSMFRHPAFSDQPVICAPYFGQNLCSAASGRYQHMSYGGDTRYNKYNWDYFQKNFPKNARFTIPQNQDLAVIWYLKKVGAYDKIINGDFFEAASIVRHEWASFEGANYNQREISKSSAYNVFLNRLKQYNEYRKVTNQPKKRKIERLPRQSSPTKVNKNPLSETHTGSIKLVPIGTDFKLLDHPIELKKHCPPNYSYFSYTKKPDGKTFVICKQGE